MTSIKVAICPQCKVQAVPRWVPGMFEAHTALKWVCPEHLDYIDVQWVVVNTEQVQTQKRSADNV